MLRGALTRGAEEIPSWWLSQHRLMRQRHHQLRCDETRLGSGGEGLGALAICTSLGAVSAADREAALWEMEEHHLQERPQLVKQQLKDQYFLQRHELLRKHEKVRLRARGSRAAPGGPGGHPAHLSEEPGGHREAREVLGDVLPQIQGPGIMEAPSLTLTPDAYVSLSPPFSFLLSCPPFHFHFVFPMHSLRILFTFFGYN